MAKISSLGENHVRKLSLQQKIYLLTYISHTIVYNLLFIHFLLTLTRLIRKNIVFKQTKKLKTSTFFLQNAEQCIKQNNAIDIYEDYFENPDEATQCEKPEAKTVHVFRDPASTYRRPISAISWCPDGGSKIAIAYCNLEFQATHPDTSKESYVFNVGKRKKILIF